MKKKENKIYSINTRYTESEYMSILLKITDDKNMQIMKPSQYQRLAALNANITVHDSELDEYKIFIASKISNNINQIAKNLNIANLQDNLTDDTFNDCLLQLEKLNDELQKLTTPFKIN
jgi:Bacterial mobilisation protein (MobC)